MRVLVTGASRGLGLEFARQYRADGEAVLATVRDPARAEAVRATGAEVLALDVTRAASIDALATRLADASLDLVICNAGILRGGAALDPVAEDDFDAVMRTNVFGPMRLVAALAPRVVDGGRIAVVSSRMGSIGDMESAGVVLYRASKAAVNAVVKAAALALAPRAITVLALHPGWVRTDIGGAGADIDAPQSVTGMRSVIARAGTAQSGHFLDYTGAQIPW